MIRNNKLKFRNFSGRTIFFLFCPQGGKKYNLLSFGSSAPKCMNAPSFHWKLSRIDRFWLFQFQPIRIGLGRYCLFFLLFYGQPRVWFILRLLKAVEKATCYLNLWEISYWILIGLYDIIYFDFWGADYISVEDNFHNEPSISPKNLT